MNMGSLIVAIVVAAMCLVGAWFVHRTEHRKRKRLSNQQVLLFKTATVSLVVASVGALVFLSGVMNPPDPDQPALTGSNSWHKMR